MHDCPACRVPLHGWEENCPSCGTKQKVRISEGGKRGSGLFAGQQKQNSVNIMPVLVVILIGGIFVFWMAQSSWVGQVMRRGPVQEDPLEKITPMQARQMLTAKINEGLTAVGAKGVYTWTQQGGAGPADMNFNGPVELNIDTELSDPSQRKQIIDPAKELMHKAQIPTLIMKDKKSRATWTYTVALPGAAPAGAEGAPSASE